MRPHPPVKQKTIHNWLSTEAVKLY